MCANREPSAIPTWEVLLDSQPSSPSGSRNSSDSERVAGLSSLSNKRKAALPPATSLRPQKFARKETSRHPGMTVTEPEAVSRTKGAFRPLPSAASPITTKKKKVQLTRNRELLHSLLKPGSGIPRRSNAEPLPRNEGRRSEAIQKRRPGNNSEIIVLSSDDDTPPSGNSSNPIVLDSDDEAEPAPAGRVTTVPPLLKASRYMSHRNGPHPISPSGSKYLARSHPSQSGSPSISGTGDESVLAVCKAVTLPENVTADKMPPPRQFGDTESPSTHIAPQPPHADMHTAKSVNQPPVANADIDQMPSSTQNGSEVRDKAPNAVLEPMREGWSPVAASPSSMSPKPCDEEFSHRLAMVRMSSSPNRSHDLPADSWNPSDVPIRGTSYSGPSGSSKDSTDEPASPSGPSHGLVEQGDAQPPKDASTSLPDKSSWDTSSSTLVSLARNLSIRTSPALSTVVRGDSLDTSNNPTVATHDAVSSVAFDRSSSQGADLSVVQFTPARMMLEFAPKVFYSRDIPHAVQDLMNTVEVHYRRSGMAKEMFEALIYENTYEDEPNAPRIAIINDDVRDQEEVTPAWEFYYSNRIWHSDGVPLPDFTNLRGCDCEGYCDPKSQTCSCLKKQQEYTGHIPGFIYDDKARLKQRGFPIFECNDLCGCLDGCRNRVVQHGRQYAVNIRKTSNKGWGIFAGRQKIPKGSFIGIYAGELLTENEGEDRGIKYNKFGRTYLFQLDFYHLRPNESSIGDGGDDEWQTKYVMDAYHAGNFTRFLNHSCDPNCAMNACYVNEANPDKPLLALFTRRDVLPWEELCFSYTGYDSDAEDDEDEHLHERGNNGDAVYAKCLCGTSKCKGVMFK